MLPPVSSSKSLVGITLGHAAGARQPKLDREGSAPLSELIRTVKAAAARRS